MRPEPAEGPAGAVAQGLRGDGAVLSVLSVIPVRLNFCRAFHGARRVGGGGWHWRHFVGEGGGDHQLEEGAGVGGVVAADAVQDDALAQAIRVWAATIGSVAPRRAITATIDCSITARARDTAARIPGLWLASMNTVSRAAVTIRLGPVTTSTSPHSTSTRSFADCGLAATAHQAYADDLAVEMVEDAAHFMADDRPDAVADRALAFFAAG